MYDVLIVGAGVIGGMIARELSRYSLSVCLLEKGNDVAVGATKANSGIVHGGYDPEPDTLKAKLNSIGAELLYNTADMLGVHYKRNGSLVCAFSDDEKIKVTELYERGLKNGIKGMKILTGKEALKLEPNLSKDITLALQVTNAGIICPYKLTIAAVGNAMDNGVELKRNFEVTQIEKTASGFTVSSKESESVGGKYLINCAGCYSDKIAEMAGDSSFEIIPRAGEYLLLDKTVGATVSHTVFQVPSKDGKGILVTPTVDGNLLTGPTAVKVSSADSNETTKDGMDAVVRLARKSVPSVDFSKVITSFTGVRSSEKDGDFIIEASKKTDGLLNVAAIDSPGLTCSVAIAEYVTGILREMGAVLEKKDNWNGYRESTDKFALLSDSEKDEFIKKNPAYGKIVCRCENISEGEIRDAIKRNPPALDMDGVKRRTRSGMGRCQGGFCSPFVMKLIAEENGVAMESVTKNGGKSNIVIGRM